jgi:hypothetical protein
MDDDLPQYHLDDVLNIRSPSPRATSTDDLLDIQYRQRYNDAMIRVSVIALGLVPESIANVLGARIGSRLFQYWPRFSSTKHSHVIACYR